MENPMRLYASASVQMPAANALALCLGLVLTQGDAIAAPHRLAPARRVDSADLSTIVPPYVRLQVARAEAADPNYPGAGTDHVVTSCADDGGPGTLRSIIEDAVNTKSGDSINLTMLPMGCSTITLGTGNIHREIDVVQDTLHIHGPGAGALMIDGNVSHSIFFHFGNGTLGISNVTIARGYYQGPYAYGGCIYSNANVLLLNTVVSSCEVKSTTAGKWARGGAIYSAGYLEIFDSIIEGNFAIADVGANARGGGISVSGGLTSVYSTIADNRAAAYGGTGGGIAGGAVVGGGVDIEGSTISGNTAFFIGGLEVRSGTTLVSNSTISDNTGVWSYGGMRINNSAIGPATIANSTVAFNTSGSSYAGIYIETQSTLTLQSSIIADNRSGVGPDDLNGIAGTTVIGANNLITSWNTQNVNVPGDTRTSCPKLDPLANNGGSTLTHKIHHDSSAIDHGDPGSLVVDQRGDLRVYPDLGMADIGAVEWQPTDQDERLLANGFDGVCDW
jgi:hypothetical protein